jgi:hypothetical protein
MAKTIKIEVPEDSFFSIHTQPDGSIAINSKNFNYNKMIGELRKIVEGKSETSTNHVTQHTHATE